LLAQKIDEELKYRGARAACKANARLLRPGVDLLVADVIEHPRRDNRLGGWQMRVKL
jgi:hypothetical protein